LGVEYSCREGDELRTRDDGELIRLAARNILGCRDAAAEASLPPEALPIGAAGCSRL
jgi:hypothetical protein